MQRHILCQPQANWAWTADFKQSIRQSCWESQMSWLLPKVRCQ